MRIGHRFGVVCAIALFGSSLAAAENGTDAGEPERTGSTAAPLTRPFSYRFAFGAEDAPTRIEITEEQRGGALVLLVEGVNGLEALPVTGGGTSTCRTKLEHRSDDAQVVLSLAIPEPNVPCSMMASFLSLTAGPRTVHEAPLRKLHGSDTALRAKVLAVLGSLAPEAEPTSSEAVEYGVTFGPVLKRGKLQVLRSANGRLQFRFTGVNGLHEVPVTRGGTSLCRTLLEHRSKDVTAILSLAIPDRRGNCRMLPSFVTLKSKKHGHALTEAPAQRTEGDDAALREKVTSALGTLGQAD